MSITFYAYGHPSILCAHPSTLEVTTDGALSSRGDCVIGVRSSLSAKDLPIMIKKTLSSAEGRARLVLEVDKYKFVIDGRGAKGLTFSNPRDLVIRKSDFISDRTLMISSTKAAVDIPRDLVQLLKNPAQMVRFNLSASTDSV